MKTIQLSYDEIEIILSWYEAYRWGGVDDRNLVKKLQDLQKASNDVTNDIDLNTISPVEDYRDDIDYQQNNNDNWAGNFEIP